MNAHGCQRAVFDLLRTEYGVTDARIEGGGKHMHLAFTAPRGSATVRTTWPITPIGRDWGVTLDVKTRDLRRMLGGPVKRDIEKFIDHPKKKEPAVEATPPTADTLADRVREKLPSLAAQLARDEAPTPEPADGPANRAVVNGCRMGCYGNDHSSNSLRLTVPVARRSLLGSNARATQVSPGVWRVVPDEHGLNVQKYGPKNVLTQWAAHEEPFACAPCAAWTEEGVLYVRLPETRVPPTSRFVPKAKAQPATELPTTASGARWVEPPTTDDIRAALAAIRRIEAETPYRLVRDGERWVFDPGLARIV
jgi:hypothetical protein